jgi:hypothetical protein
MGVDIVWVTQEKGKGRRDFLFSIYAISPFATFLWNLSSHKLGNTHLRPLLHHIVTL